MRIGGREGEVPFCSLLIIQRSTNRGGLILLQRDDGNVGLTAKKRNVATCPSPHDEELQNLTARGNAISSFPRGNPEWKRVLSKITLLVAELGSDFSPEPLHWPSQVTSMSGRPPVRGEMWYPWSRPTWGVRNVVPCFPTASFLTLPSSLAWSKFHALQAISGWDGGYGTLESSRALLCGQIAFSEMFSSNFIT